jgi:hypothetical protein
MEKNMGSVDRIVRAIIAAFILALYMTKIITGTLGVILIIFSVVFLLTSFVSFCPLYRILGLSTQGKNKHA